MNASPPLLSIRRLVESDAAAFNKLRLYSLQESADAFGASLEDEKNKTPGQIEGQIKNGCIYGAFAGRNIIGMLCSYTSPLKKLSHKAHLYGGYVHPDHRKTGVMQQLLTAILADLFQRHEAVMVTVVEGNNAQLDIFLANGFVSYGIEEKAMKTNGTYSNLIRLRRDADGK